VGFFGTLLHEEMSDVRTSEKWSEMQLLAEVLLEVVAQLQLQSKR
jgi:hypothetical protein